MKTLARKKYEELLVALHTEMKEGRGELDAARGLRDDMTTIWYELSDEDQDLVDGLSEGLYVIEGKRPGEALWRG